MTRISPEMAPVDCQPLFAGMDQRAAQLAHLAPQACGLTLLDLELLRPLLERGEALRFLTSLLSPGEAALFARFSAVKRRTEWLGGRLAAKHCLCALLGAQVSAGYRDVAVLPEASGRPRCDTVPARPPLALSISHSQRYAAALAGFSTCCGIDIQQATAQLVNVAERFTSAKELSLFASEPDRLIRLGMIWAVKEAVKKCFLPDHPGLFDATSITAAHPLSGKWEVLCRLQTTRETLVTVRVARFADYLIACTSGAHHA